MVPAFKSKKANKKSLVRTDSNNHELIAYNFMLCIYSNNPSTSSNNVQDKAVD
jgi:hypothetical protein